MGEEENIHIFRKERKKKIKDAKNEMEDRKTRTNVGVKGKRAKTNTAQMNGWLQYEFAGELTTREGGVAVSFGESEGGCKRGGECKLETLGQKAEKGEQRSRRRERKIERARENEKRSKDGYIRGRW